MILGCRPIYRFAGANSIRIVGIRNRITIMRYRRQSSPILPGESKAVSVGEGVASFIADVGLLYESVQEESNPNVILFTLGYSIGHKRIPAQISFILYPGWKHDHKP